jgi:37-kD nucleoid-associated bacterial protein
MSQFNNFSIQRLIAHEIITRKAAGMDSVSPTYSKQITPLPLQARKSLEARVLSSLLTDRSCLEMELVNLGPESLITQIIACIDSDEDGFILPSQEIAELLWKAQRSPRIPGGVIIISSGITGIEGKKFLCIVKAEKDTGFTKKTTNGNIDLDFVTDLLLTNSKQLLKVAIFIKESDENEFTIFAADPLLRMQDGRINAEYFVRDFLGCKVANTAKVQTKKFYDATLNVITDLNIPEPTKYELIESFSAYMKGNDLIVSPSDFAAGYIPTVELREEFTSKFTSRFNLIDPEEPINKDNTLLEARLKKNVLIFDNKVKISGPSDSADAIEILKGNEDDDFVTVRIHGKLTGR